MKTVLGSCCRVSPHPSPSLLMLEIVRERGPSGKDLGQEHSQPHRGQTQSEYGQVACLIHYHKPYSPFQTDSGLCSGSLSKICLAPSLSQVL